MTKDQLQSEILNVAKLTGEFKLRSGQTSSVYFDKYQFESRPKLLSAIATHLKDMIPSDTEVLAGLELGGVPVATALSLLTGIPVAFIRKSAKDYGTCKFAEGVDIKGKKVCVIEDVITTGGQVVLSTNDLRAEGAQIHTICSVIFRGKAFPPKFKELDIELKSLFDFSSLT